MFNVKARCVVILSGGSGENGGFPSISLEKPNFSHSLPWIFWRFHTDLSNFTQIFQRREDVIPINFIDNRKFMKIRYFYRESKPNPSPPNFTEEKM